MARATNFLHVEMGLGLKDHRDNVPITFTRDEYNKYTQRFRSLDSENKGYITVNDLRRYFKVSQAKVICKVMILLWSYECLLLLVLTVLYEYILFYMLMCTGACCLHCV